MKICDYRDVRLDEVGEEGAEGVSVRWVISKEDGAENFSMRVFDVQPGGHTPHHKHKWEHEVFILDGEAMVVTEEGEKSAPAGSIVFVSPDEQHQFKNETNKVLRFICLIPNPD